jgi:hypothetical protein
MLFSLEEYIEIELILSEANSVGLKGEVEEYAKRFLEEGCSPIEAYQLAYEEWVK